jgi:hypothetical protein
MQTPTRSHERKVEHIAREFYRSIRPRDLWDAEPEALRAYFRQCASRAIEFQASHGDQGREGQLVWRGDRDPTLIN